MDSHKSPISMCLENSCTAAHQMAFPSKPLQNKTSRHAGRLRLKPELSVLLQRDSITQQEICSSGWCCRNIHSVWFPVQADPPCSCFPVHITPLEHFQTCFCADCDLHVQLIILAHRPARSSEQLVDHGMQPICQKACCFAQT
jgi:hypothetical protein